MTWHLKDRELEKKLEEFTGGDFVDSLNREIERDNIDSEFFVWVEFGRKLSGDDNKENCLLFRTDELEEVPEYNPKAWNEYPKVTPPEGVPMRVETNMGFGFKARFEHGDWLDNRNDVVGFDDGNVIRFRPWNED